MNWDDQKSLKLSVACVWVFFLLLAALDIGCYWLVEWFLSIPRVTLGHGLREGLLLMSSLYLCSLPAWTLLLNLYGLLGSIGKGHVFTAQNVARLRRVSWCCIAVCVVCLASALYYLPWLLGGAAAGFMALIVRIVKNCFEQALRMKDELDFTI